MRAEQEQATTRRGKVSVRKKRGDEGSWINERNKGQRVLWRWKDLEKKCIMYGRLYGDYLEAYGLGDFRRGENKSRGNKLQGQIQELVCEWVSKWVKYESIASRCGSWDRNGQHGANVNLDWNYRGIKFECVTTLMCSSTRRYRWVETAKVL